MKKESDYSKTIIYKIECRNSQIKEFYIGHSTNIYVRTHLHKFYSKIKESKLYSFIRNHGGFDNWKITKIEDYPCQYKYDALARERFYIEDLKPELNENLPHRGYKELRKKNIEKYNLYMKYYMKEYYQKMKAKKNEHLVSDIHHDGILYFD